MEDYRKKQMTKAQMWEKIHNERIMWQMQVQRAREEAIKETTWKMRQISNLLIASIVKPNGMQEGDAWYIDTTPLEADDGCMWDAKVKALENGTIRIQVEQVKLEPEEKQQEEEK